LAKTIPRQWTHADFGQGEEKGLKNQHKDNMREVLTRVRLLAQDLPDELEAHWPYFLEVAPAIFYRRFGAAIGIGFVNELKDLVQALQERPKWFQGWMRQWLDRYKGDFRL
jgi:hypothetical protein